jgi:hypothetical protein
MRTEITENLALEVTNFDHVPEERGDLETPDTCEGVIIHEYKVLLLDDEGNVVHEKEGNPFSKVFDWGTIEEELLGYINS